MSEVTISELVSMDLCLKFADEAQAIELLYIPVTQSITEYLEDGSAVVTSAVVEGEYTLRYAALVDTVGVIYKATGQVLAEGSEAPEMAPLEGWHVNLRGSFSSEHLEALQPFVVLPQAPVRVWA